LQCEKFGFRADCGPTRVANEGTLSADCVKPEATYFGLESGQRTGFFVFDMDSSQQCPEIAEAFFDAGCDIHLSPCMTPDDLMAGLGAAGLG
jgi:hypothetical protein